MAVEKIPQKVATDPGSAHSNLDRTPPSVPNLDVDTLDNTVDITDRWDSIAAPHRGRSRPDATRATVDPDPPGLAGWRPRGGRAPIPGRK